MMKALSVRNDDEIQHLGFGQNKEPDVIVHFIIHPNTGVQLDKDKMFALCSRHTEKMVG